MGSKVPCEVGVGPMNADAIIWRIGECMEPGKGCPEDVEYMIRCYEAQIAAANRFAESQAVKATKWNEARIAFNKIDEGLSIR